MGIGKKINKEKIENSNELQGKKIVQKELENLLCGNPFLFTKKDYSDFIYSIEDFNVKYDGEYFRFEEIIRTTSLTKKDKRKIITNQLNDWELDTENEILKGFKKSKDIIAKCDLNKHIKYKFKYYIQFFLAFVFSVIMFLKVLPIPSFMENYYLLISGVNMILCIIGVIAAILQGRLTKKFVSIKSKHIRHHEKLSKKIYKILSKSLKKIKKYYINNISNELFLKDPLKLEDINNVGKKLDVFIASTNTLEELYVKMLNKNQKKSFGHKLSIMLSYLTFFTSSICILIILITFIIEKIF